MSCDLPTKNHSSFLAFWVPSSLVPPRTGHRALLGKGSARIEHFSYFSPYIFPLFQFNLVYSPLLNPLHVFPPRLYFFLLLAAFSHSISAISFSLMTSSTYSRHFSLLFLLSNSFTNVLSLKFPHVSCRFVL